MRIVSLLFLIPLLLTSACAELGMKRPVEKAAAENIRNIAVVSVFEPSMHHIYIGFTVFENEAMKKRVPEWRIKEFSEQTMVKTLKTKGIGQKVSAFRAPEMEFASKEEAFAYFKTVRDAGYDTLIMITPANNDNIRFMKPGYGLFKRSVLGMGRPCAYAAFNVRAIDTSEPRELGWQWGWDSWNEGPCIETKIWKNSPDELTAAELKEIEALVKERISKGIPTAVDALHLKAANE